MASAQVDKNSYNQLVADAVAKYQPLQTSTMLAIQNAENPGLSVGATSWTGVQGLAQITQATWNQWNPGVPYSTNPAAQIDTQARILASYTQKYNGDVALIAAAYNGGPGVSNLAVQLMKQNPNLSEAEAISQAAAHYFDQTKVNEINNYVAKVSKQPAATTQSQNPSATSTNGLDKFDTTNSIEPVDFVGVQGQTISASQLNSYVAQAYPTKVISAGLSETPWFSDLTILQPPIARYTGDNGFPVVFNIHMDSTGFDDLNINIPMVASIKTWRKSMRHVINNQSTRTGWLINTWGMALDTLDGTATTGIMMNMKGLSSFISLRGSSETDLVAALGSLQNAEDEAGTFVDGNLRVAARDAFNEFLSMFKNNGTVWYQSPNYTGFSQNSQQNQPGETTTNYDLGEPVSVTSDQLAPDVWSPITGSSTLQNAARRMDVMSRGGVVMNFRNATYTGYFKSLTVNMSADKPFQWEFSFSFQVENTQSFVSLPRLGATGVI